MLQQHFIDKKEYMPSLSNYSSTEQDISNRTHV